MSSKIVVPFVVLALLGGVLFAVHNTQKKAKAANEARRARAELAVAIRTFWKEERTVKFGTGAGITWASDPASEWDETELKAGRLIRIASGEIS